MGVFWELLLEPLTELDKLPTDWLRLSAAEDAAELVAMAGDTATPMAKTKREKTDLANFIVHFQKNYYRTSPKGSDWVVRNKLRGTARSSWCLCIGPEKLTSFAIFLRPGIQRKRDEENATATTREVQTFTHELLTPSLHCGSNRTRLQSMLFTCEKSYEAHY